MQIFDDKQIDLDLNGPILSFTTNPTGVGSTGVGINSTGGGTVSLTGIATATFPTSANNTGYVTYRWHEQGVGALSNSTYVTGTATTTLTLSNLITPSDNNRKFFLQADYVPSYYVTGNATNEPLNSGIGTITVDPLLEIIAQPSTKTTIPNNAVTFNVDASLTDDSTDKNYQWRLDGDDVTDGTVTKSTVQTTTNTAGDTITIVTEATSTDATFLIPANVTDVRFDCAAGGGGKGSFTGSDNSGAGGEGISQWFNLSTSTSARNVRFVVGQKGNDGQIGSGGIGGGSPDQPNSVGTNGGNGGDGQLGGGGGGGATVIYLDDEIVAVLGGGAGGGAGGATGTGGDGQSYVGGGEGLVAVTDAISPEEGSVGGSGAPTNTAGGGGGGGGMNLGGDGGNGGEVGQGGTDFNSGTGGKRGQSGYRSDLGLSPYSGSRNSSSGWASLTYKITESGATTTSVTNVTRTTTVQGSSTDTLSLSTDGPGIGYTVSAVVSSSTASNSPLTTDIVNYHVVSEVDDAIVSVEAINSNSSTSTISTVNLSGGVELELGVSPADPDNNIFIEAYSLYAQDRDIDVEMDLYGGKGASGSAGVGGEGGYSRIRFTMTQNEEYVIVGLNDIINTPFVYSKGSLLAVVGGGGIGGGSNSQRGGAGGGVNISGAGGVGAQGGDGGSTIEELTLNGIFGSSFEAPTLYPGDQQASNQNGGRTIRCTKGVYWSEQGILPCDDITGSTKFRLSDGTEVTNTGEITRGYKAGYNIIQTGGAGFESTSRGGNGVSGGNGGSSENGAGGGGAGYQNGTVTVVDTQLGGSTGDAKIILRIQS